MTRRRREQQQGKLCEATNLRPRMLELRLLAAAGSLFQKQLRGLLQLLHG